MGTKRMTSIYLYVPNLIGYVRVILALAAYYFAFDNWLIFITLYAASEFMDALDGHAARYFNQSTMFGAVLDQVTDRCSTAGLMILLAIAYPSYAVVFIFCLFLDIFAHWFQMYTSVAVGNTSHKNVPNSRFLLKIYYESRPLMFIAHGCNEAFFMCMFALSQIGVESAWASPLKLLACTALPLCLYKQWTNVLQLEYAANILCAFEQEKKKEIKK
eukprot:GDKJ01002534.1.p1 GENE.GDKJ01002534.1~~GDKJ01002534.1.p1  ORF type:complete len:216 (-),score=46.74 GDKJ01002534.1:77-724(-)